MTLRYLLSNPLDVLDATPVDALAFVFMGLMAVRLVIYAYVLLFHT